MMKSDEDRMLRLHEIQVLLKREAILYSDSGIESATGFPEERDSSLEMLASRKLILASYQILLLKDPPSALLSSFCKLMLQCARGGPVNARPTNVDLSRFTDPFSLSAFCIDFLTAPKGDADLLTFSLVPSFFCCLWSDRCAESFVDFLCEIDGRSPAAARTLGRALFALPVFGMFLWCVISDVKAKPHTLTDTSLRPSSPAFAFSTEFENS
jgi:hypothetical protein